jgi:DNA-binding transcriptional regulator GbsR (MarR family)
VADKRSHTHEEALDRFVLLWGEMASAWGINKTMAQIHALLYAESDPLDTDAIMAQLDISRGNANMNLRNLLKWQLVHKVHFKGSRKDHYTAEKEVWSIVATIIGERQQREVAPIRENLNECLQLFDDKENLSEEESDFRERIENFTEFLEMFERFTEALLPYINKRNLKFLKQLVKLAEMKHSITGEPPSASSTDQPEDYEQ